MAWRNYRRCERYRLSRRNGNIRGCFRCRGPPPDQSEKIPSFPLLADDRRDDHGRYDAGRLLHRIASHRVHRWVEHIAGPGYCVAPDLALVHRKHIDRNRENAESRSLLLGNNNVFADTWHGTRRLDLRYQRNRLCRRGGGFRGPTPFDRASLLLHEYLTRHYVLDGIHIDSPSWSCRRRFS